MPELAASPPRVLLRRQWTRRTSLTVRILAVNIIALGLMAGSLFYIDSYRKQLLGERFQLARGEARIAAAGIAAAAPDRRRALIGRIGADQQLRLRLYGPDGALVLDSFAISGRAYQFLDPRADPWLLKTARVIDRSMNWVLGSPPVPFYADPPHDIAANWPELELTRASGDTTVMQRAAPDETPVITAATPVGVGGEMLLVSRNARDITQHVRDARQTLVIALTITLLISVQLSLFLARTIVQPLRALVRAAVRVRLGRDRAVEVPRLPDRGDEIGLLARALSDMTGALRQRIDAVEAFAADVAHEIKNPLASLRSALESLEKVSDDGLRGELTAIAAHDVRRIDRLVTEIAEASRIDAELSRTQFNDVDLMILAQNLVAARYQRGDNGQCRVAVVPADAGPWVVKGDAARLSRVLENLLDNAVSFSPANGRVDIAIARHDDHVVLAVSDHGPGIPLLARDKIFDRFHSLRPEGEQFGSHSGLGLAIARTIAAAHDGTLTAHDRDDGASGAQMVLQLPVAGDDDGDGE